MMTLAFEEDDSEEPRFYVPCFCISGDVTAKAWRGIGGLKTMLSAMLRTVGQGAFRHLRTHPRTALDEVVERHHHRPPGWHLGR